MRISDWSSDVCSSDLRKPEDEAEHDRCDRADQRPGLGRARPEQAEQEDDRDPRRDEAREFLDILERLIETAKQRAGGEDREDDRHHRGGAADQNQLFLLPFLARGVFGRSEEHTSELQSLMRISYA